MSKKTYIWDLDGTLLDSYEIIVNSLYQLCCEVEVSIDREEIHRHVIAYSVSSFISALESKTQNSYDKLKTRYSEISNIRQKEIKPIPHAITTLKVLMEEGARHLVFTHRGNSTMAVLHNTGLYDFFEEIITSQSGFERKPSPQAIHYFVKKYNIEPDMTYYVGDRSIDMECAKNAGIKSILYLPVNSYGKVTGLEDYVVDDLQKIIDL